MQFPANEKILDKFKEVLDWSELSSEINLQWSEDLIDKYIDKWDWDLLSYNKELPWSEELIERYFDKWNWKLLSENKSVPFTSQLIYKFKENWVWNELNSLSLIDNFFENITESEIQEIIKKKDSNIYSYKKTNSREIEINDVLKIILKDDNNFIFTLIYRFCRLDLTLISQPKNEFDERQLSLNENIEWSEELIEKFENLWDWECLSTNNSIPWNIDLIEKYKEKWSWDEQIKYYRGDSDDKQYYQPGNLWHGLSENYSIPWSEELIDKYLDKWDWVRLSANQNLPWSVSFILKYKSKWDRINLSENLSVISSLEIIESCSELFGGYHLVHTLGIFNFLLLYNEVITIEEWLSGDIDYNTSLNWSLHQEILHQGRYYNNNFIWQVEILSSNEFFEWTQELIERYEDSWNWDVLSQNKTLPWSINFIERFKESWHWDFLSVNESIPWTEALLEKFKKNLNWKGLSYNTALPWTEQLIDKYEDRWFWGKYKNDFLYRDSCGEIQINNAQLSLKNKNYALGRFGLSSNIGLPWSEQLIEKYKYKWEWNGLSRNEAIPWSLNLIEKYFKHWGSTYLVKNKGVGRFFYHNISEEHIINLVERYRNLPKED
jgi:hypothetical protein